MKYGELTLGQVEAIVNKLGGMDRVYELLRDNLTVKPSSLLKRIATIEVGYACGFIGKEHFKKNIRGERNNVMMQEMVCGFTDRFWGKVEKEVQPAILGAYDLLTPASDVEILAELGKRAEISLAHLWQLLLRQPCGQPGPLHTDGKHNIFYIRGVDDLLWTVQANWHGLTYPDSRVGWGFFAHSPGPVEERSSWYEGLRILAR